jgi:hypothetical protein
VLQLEHLHASPHVHAHVASQEQDDPQMQVAGFEMAAGATTFLVVIEVPRVGVVSILSG